MKKFTFLLFLVSLLLIATNGNATLLGEGSDDHKNRIMDGITYADGVVADDDFYFDYVSKFDNLDTWDGDTLEFFDDSGNLAFTLSGDTKKLEDDKVEWIGGTYTVNPDSGIEFFSLKAGSGNSGAGFAIYNIDGTGTGSWSTADNLDGKGISHVSIWAGAGGNITPPGGGAQVPEPATIFLLGSGLLGLFGYRKKFWKPKN
jgi:hypothetical protein